MILLFFLCVSAIPDAVQAETQQNNVKYYYTVMDGKKSGIYQMQLKGSKLIIAGTFAKDNQKRKAEDKYYQGKTLDYRRRTFRLSPKCKFYSTGGEDPITEYSRDIFENCYVKHPDLGLGFLMKIKNGKVVAIYTMS